VADVIECSSASVRASAKNPVPPKKKDRQKRKARCQWLGPIIQTTQEAEMREITVLSQPRQTVSSQDPISKKPVTKKAGGVAQGVGLEFKPQY
jgi:hypothetical protein